jgi:predicted nucleotidyltransferase
MAVAADRGSLDSLIKRYLDKLRENNFPLWRVYLYGSCVRGAQHEFSDIDLAIFLDREDIDGFQEDADMLKLRRDIDLRIETHSFARTDFDETDPFIKEVIETGRRIL